MIISFSWDHQHFSSRDCTKIRNNLLASAINWWIKNSFLDRHVTTGI